MKKQRDRRSTQSPTWRSPLMLVSFVVVLAVALFAIWRLLPASGDAAGALSPEVSVAQAAALRDQGAFVLDVREPVEWNEVHVPDSTLIPLSQLSSRLSEIPTDRPVVVICRSGNRSAQGRDVLLDAGFTRVTSIAGGIQDWSAQGMPTVSGE